MQDHDYLYSIHDLTKISSTPFLDFDIQPGIHPLTIIEVYRVTQMDVSAGI